jgi:hypothetical protein
VSFSLVLLLPRSGLLLRRHSPPENEKENVRARKKLVIPIDFPLKSGNGSARRYALDFIYRYLLLSYDLPSNVNYFISLFDWLDANQWGEILIFNC